MPKTPEEMEASMIRNLEEKTGKTLESWLKLTRASKLEKHGQIVKHLKTEHNIGHGYATLIAHKFLRSDAQSAAQEVDLVSAQYSGPKKDLRPIYDALVKAVTRFGKDVELSPKKAYVSLRRKKQFGLIQPSTQTRVDLGLNLKGVKPTKRLETSGSFSTMCTHRVRLTGEEQVDTEVIGWLKAAYDKA